MFSRSVRFRCLLPTAYLLAGAAWVLGSDALLGRTAAIDLAVQVAASAKGLCFVVLSALLLYAVQSWPKVADRDGVGAAPRRNAWRALLISLIGAAGVTAGGATFYLQQEHEVQGRAESSLVDAADLTARQIELWLDDRRSGLEYAGSNELLAQGIGLLQGGQRSGAPIDALRAALDLLRYSEELDRLQVFDADGHPLIDSGGPVAMTDRLRHWTRGAAITGRVVMSDLYVPADAATDKPVVDFVATVIDTRRRGAPLAVLVARADPARFLFPTIVPDPGERLVTNYALARRNAQGITLLTTRWVGGQRTIPVDLPHVAADTAVAQVLAGRADVFEAPDHRGVPMLATGRAIGTTPWYLVAAVDKARVHGPLQRLARLALLFALAGLTTAALLVALWWRSERLTLTERIDAAERRATRLQRHFAIAGRLVHDLVVLIDADDQRILEANDRAIEAYGYTREEMLALRVDDLRPGNQAERLASAAMFAHVTASGGGSYSVHHRRKDGTTFPVEISARTLEIDGHTYVQAIARDVSERVEQERRVAAIAAERDRLLERLQLQFEHMAAACVVVSPDGHFVQVNPAFERVFGLPAESVVGRHVAATLQLPQFREEVVARLRDLQANPDRIYSGVHENVTAQGRAIICRWKVAAMSSDDGTVRGFVAMADDITELVRAETALRGSEARYRALSEVSPVGIYRTDIAGQTVFVNARACEIIGLDQRQSLAHGWVRAIHPADVTATRAAWDLYLESAGRVPYVPEFRMVRPDGSVVWVLAQVAPEYDGDGRLVGHVGTITDITAIKRAQLELQQAHDLLEQRVRERTQELEAAKDAAEHSDRVKTAFLSSMSHELRTPLNAILGFTDVLLQQLPGPLTPEQERQLQMVGRSSRHLRTLVEDVLDISRIEAGQVGLEFGDVDLADLLERRVEAFRDLAQRKGLRLVLEAPAGATVIRSDARRIAQVLGNLLSNALKFTDAGEVVVTLQPGPTRVEVTVADTGCGIAETALGQIFDPFAQVARPGGRLRDGTGLGLAISRNLARALGGDVVVRSEVGHGSRFMFWLPAVTTAAAA